MTRIVAVSATEAGREITMRLPYERRHGEIAASVRELWHGVDGFVLVLAAGAAVRIIAPLLGDKATDPAVVCIDDAGRHVVALLGGHSAGANALAREAAGILGAEPVVTTGTDTSGTPALDQLPGFTATGDIAGVTASMLNGNRPTLECRISWPVPTILEAVTSESGDGGRIVVTDEALGPGAGVVALVPPSLVVGVGSSTDATPGDIAGLLDDTLSKAGLSRAAVHVVATIDRRHDHPALTALGHPVRSFSASQLAQIPVPNPSGAVADAVGTPSVAEAAALIASGPGAHLIVTKRTSVRATVAVARRARPTGTLTLVGLGPGGPLHRTPAATAALRSAEVVIGFHAYLDQCADALSSSQEIIGSLIGNEVERARTALTRARSGARTALVCSGDAGVYAMASLVFEECSDRDAGAADVEIEVVPGVTAGLAASALLGAPLGHDHVVLSLSDLLTPWEVISRRVQAARDGDYVVVLYNPRSTQRDWQLGAVRDALLEARPDTTPVGIVTDAGRAGETVTLTTLAELDPDLVGMTTCVIIGSTSTRVVAGRMVTPRGYDRSLTS